MQLTTLATVFVLLLLTTCVCCQDDPGPEIENEVEKEVAKEVDNKIDNALETVCQAFSPDDDDQTDPQPTKRGFFSKAWKAIKNAAVGYVVTNAIKAIGKRDLNGFDSETNSVSGTIPVDICDSETQKNIEKLEQAIEVLGRVTFLVQALKQCNAPSDSP